MRPYYQHDGITIYHGEALSVLSDLPAEVAGAVVTDPPYSSGGAFRDDRVRSTVEKYAQSGVSIQHQNFSGDNRDQRSFMAWCSMWLNAARIASEPGAVLCSFIDWRQLPTLTDAVQCGGWIWRGLATWWKPGIRMQRGSFSGSSEFVVHGTNGASVRDYEGAQQNVFKCAPVGGVEKEHLAQKPVEVMKWVLNVTPPGCVVLDPFMGSGTTLLAAKETHRQAIGIDEDERYCEIAAKRLAQGNLFSSLRSVNINGEEILSSPGSVMGFEFL